MLSATIARISSETLPEYANRREISKNKFTLKSSVTRGIRKGVDFLIQPGRSQVAGRMCHLGFAVGKGWKTIRIYNDGSVTSGRYLSGLMLKPSRFKDAATSTNIISNSGEMDVHICQFPYGTASSSSNLVPASMVLTTVSLPIPDGLFNWMFLTSNAYETLPFFVDILVRGSADNGTNPNEFSRYIMYRQSGSPTLAISKAYGDNVIAPQSAMIQKAPGGQAHQSR